MKIYGYENEGSELVSLHEMTLQISIEELKELSGFILNTICIMEKYGESFGHEHFSDFLKHRVSPDIIITK
ncbi:hypothetical protein CBF17_023990 [Pantoea agglomerans]|uniref:hypothetical protein n=1 Tax=Enterobacter agglomerans TaxID=549 RepID=UPI000C06F9B1|nr:hypothetical protein [Pantoea agglomerans]PHP91306.1 hypothetical protein CBF17_023990 [Pantoea agglomerans]